MIRDTATIDKILQGLPFDQKEYRGNLRVIISASLRIRDTCLALLGEQDPSNTINPVLPSMIIDGETGRQVFLHDGPDVGEDPPRGNSYPTRKNGRVPKPAKRSKGTDPDAAEPVGRKAEILQVLRKQALTSGDLIERLKPTGASAQTIYATLTTMRNEGLIDTRNDPIDGQRKNFVK